MPVIRTSCSCGEVQGKTENVSSSIGNRLSCCCGDCQMFARFLEKEDVVLDEYGGTDIFQMPISMLQITQGTEHIACLRLSEKGLYRWYASCCNTPIGNTLGAGAPFVGLIHNFLDNLESRDEDLGVSRGYGLTKSARKEVPQEQKTSFFVLLRSVFKFISWKLRGLNKPSSFFNEDGQAIVKPIVLSEVEKKRLSIGEGC